DIHPTQGSPTRTSQTGCRTQSQPRRLSFFFLLLRRPPRPTLFPTRRSSDLSGRLAEGARLPGDAELTATFGVSRPVLRESVKTRSEEHTSELQSQSNLVCRLLLEKKKTTSCRRRSGLAARSSV